MKTANEQEYDRADVDRVLLGKGYIRRHPGGFDEYIPASQLVELSGTMDTDPKTLAELREWMKARL